VVIALVMDATPPLHQMESVPPEETSTSTEEATQNRWMLRRHHIRAVKLEENVTPPLW
jgi:hypothetical protein